MKYSPTVLRQDNNAAFDAVLSRMATNLPQLTTHKVWPPT
jgi:hypothetical protein